MSDPVVELRTILVALILLSLMTVPASAGEDGTTLSCTVLLGAPGFVADTPVGGIGGCTLGEAASPDGAFISTPVECQVQAIPDDDGETWLYGATCETGVVDATITVTFQD